MYRNQKSFGILYSRNFPWKQFPLPQVALGFIMRAYVPSILTLIWSLFLASSRRRYSRVEVEIYYLSTSATIAHVHHLQQQHLKIENVCAIWKLSFPFDGLSYLFVCDLDRTFDS